MDHHGSTLKGSGRLLRLDSDRILFENDMAQQQPAEKVAQAINQKIGPRVH